MRDFDGIKIEEKIESEIEKCLENLSYKYLITIDFKDKNLNNRTIAYSLNGNRFTQNNKNSFSRIIKEASKENIKYFKNILLKKWINNDEVLQEHNFDATIEKTLKELRRVVENSKLSFRMEFLQSINELENRLELEKNNYN